MRKCHVCHQPTTSTNYRCRPCNAAYMREYYKANPDKLRIKRAKSVVQAKLVSRARYLAYKAVANAVARGKLIKPSVCSNCKQPGRIEAHHPKGYHKPYQLIVVWLCKACYVAAHLTVPQPY